jgi:hypothetical protein
MSRFPVSVSLVLAFAVSSTAKPAPLGTSEKWLRGSMRPATHTYLAGEESLQCNCVVVLLIVGAVYKGYPAPAVRLQDRFHSCGVRV